MALTAALILLAIAAAIGGLAWLACNFQLTRRGDVRLDGDWDEDEEDDEDFDEQADFEGEADADDGWGDDDDPGFEDDAGFGEGPTDDEPLDDALEADAVLQALRRRR